MNSRRNQPHGMCPSEQVVMDLHDAGLSARKISQKVGYPLTRVQTIISKLHGGRDMKQDAFWEMIRRGSDLLCARILEVYGAVK